VIVYPSEISAEKIEEVMKAGRIPKALIPLQRPGTIEDMAGAVLYLTSKAGSYLNGNVLVTDGGRLIVIPATY
jgi:NAD(P)-dependent dehydrogenase (short-subunit alcohol dehydrogenase family)